MARKKKKNYVSWIVGGIIIFVMVTSALGVIFGGYANIYDKYEYNDIEFVDLGRTFRAEIDGRVLDFGFLPEQVENIEMDERMVTALRNSAEIDFTYNYSSPAAGEMALVIFQMQEVYLKEIKFIRTGSLTENEFEQPIITCSDSTPSVPVIVIRMGNETQIRQEGNCFFAEASRASDIMVLRDRFVYSILEVMD
jgi:hypothetical protein